MNNCPSCLWKDVPDNCFIPEAGRCFSCVDGPKIECFICGFEYPHSLMMGILCKVCGEHMDGMSCNNLDWWYGPESEVIMSESGEYIYKYPYLQNLDRAALERRWRMQERRWRGFYEDRNRRVYWKVEGF